MAKNFRLSEILAKADEITKDDLHRLGQKRKHRRALEEQNFKQISEKCLRRYKKKGVEKPRCRFWDYPDTHHSWRGQWTKACNIDDCPGMNGKWGPIEFVDKS